MIEVGFRTFANSERPLIDKEQVRAIFFSTTTRQHFSDDLERNSFFENWTSYYFDKYPEHFYFAYLKNKPNEILGYLSGCTDSFEALSFFNDRISSYKIFSEFFLKYPAHLHINCDPKSQGLGIGAKLVEVFLQDLKLKNIKGIHIVTSGESRNISFYKRLGFDFEIEKDFNGSRLRFMGKSLI